ncbi:ferrochelatase [Arcanobacterium wilhelmae]|uniref:Coproporphyrin III ferrochelatase n=1 Tax=Arcanobacterium wilhelmae TaxID=1803177 RepID=A0ABT9NBX1_9ACTO|nr:ferrochelatase [Arcanobacterium wilhelmae]MDP9800985.1 ferrochelatase [Arcanobacterium wilhelmae]WFN90345.1 ferrochelatase [Arcanobacterium wilhelmae]
MSQAYLLLSYGGPYKPEDVVPFLRNATRGRGIPDERLAVVGKHYSLFGGKSPINERNEELRAAVEARLRAAGAAGPVLVANRNWHPFGADVLRELAAAGVTRVRAIPTAAYVCYSSCRQYSEDIARWLAESGAPIEIERVAPFWDTPGFYAATRRIVAEALAARPHARIVFVTHSIPSAMEAVSGLGHVLEASVAPDAGAQLAPNPTAPDEASVSQLNVTVSRETVTFDGSTDTYPSYVEQHKILARSLAAELGIDEWDLVYCSRSGSPHTPWLEPDICDHLADLHERGIDAVTVVPFGFISDHMEVVYDLDTQARETAAELGMDYHRAPTLGTAPEFVDELARLFLEPNAPLAPQECCPSGAPRGHRSGHASAKSPIPASEEKRTENTIPTPDVGKPDHP